MDHIKNIIHQAEQASQGNYNIEKAAIGVKGYGFVFRYLFKEDNPSFITGKYSSRICTFAQFRTLHFILLQSIEYIGRLKTLLPSIELGGYYHFFSVWVFVITPTNKRFPMIFYYGKNGFTFGGWDDFLFSKLLKEEEDDKNLVNFIHYINCNPFELNQEELQDLAKNLILSLKLTLVSEFQGITEQDSHKTLIAYLDNKEIVKPYPLETSNDEIFNNLKKENKKN